MGEYPIGTIVRATRFNEVGVVVQPDPEARFDFTAVLFDGTRHHGKVNFVPGELEIVE